MPVLRRSRRSLAWGIVSASGDRFCAVGLHFRSGLLDATERATLIVLVPCVTDDSRASNAIDNDAAMTPLAGLHWLAPT